MRKCKSKNKMFAGGEILGMAKGLAGNTSLQGAAGSVLP